MMSAGSSDEEKAVVVAAEGPWDEEEEGGAEDPVDAEEDTHEHCSLKIYFPLLPVLKYHRVLF